MKWHTILHPRFIRALENDARVQARFHQRMSYVWLVVMVLVCFIHIFNYSAAVLFLIEISLYSNFSTEYGALAAAQSAMKDRPSNKDILRAIIHDSDNPRM